MSYDYQLLYNFDAMLFFCGFNEDELVTCFGGIIYTYLLIVKFDAIVASSYFFLEGGLVEID